MHSLTVRDLRGMAARWLPPEGVPKRIRIVTDTTDFFRVDYDDVVLLEERAFLIRTYEREGRFGIDEEPKFWVRRALDLEAGTMKIIKMVFRERFIATLGGLSFECVRSPQKEARILELTRGMRHFMQGMALPDERGNLIRVLDRVRGRPFCDHVLALGAEHEDYYHVFFPGVLGDFLDLLRAVAFLHSHGETHGDIRRDHIIREGDSGIPVWIDFDYLCMRKENPCGYDLAGLGNVLLFAAGRGDVTLHGLRKESSGVLDRLRPEDMNIVFRNRVANLRKVYPYMSERLNRVLLHFSEGARVYYGSAGELLDDLLDARESL